MGALVSIQPIKYLIIIGLCLSLWGCGLTKPKPPRAAVETAIAQKIAQTQALLHGQRPTSDTSAAPFQVSSVKITHHQWTTLADQPVVEVEGTYRLTGERLSRAQQRQARAFDLYLQQGATDTDWTLVDLNPG